MDYNTMPFGIGLAYPTIGAEMDSFSNMTDDEKKEYIERHRSRMSQEELDNMTASLGKSE